jgi:hypothetical protein
MTGSADPTVHRMALWRRLENARVESGLNQQQVAEAMGWAFQDFLLVEAVADGIDDGRLLALLGRYGILDVTRDLYQAVHVLNPREIPLSAQVRVLLEYEKLASGIRTFEPFVIPGLLQTAGYAEAALRLFASPEEVGSLVEARLARRAIFDRRDMPEMVFLIDESALHRWAGSAGAGPAIMRGQLDRLRQISRDPRVRIQIVPYDVGLYEGVKGPFVILEFADPGRCDLLYLEDAKGDLVRAGSEDVERYFERFTSLADCAASARDLDGFLDRALTGLNASPGA